MNTWTCERSFSSVKRLKTYTHSTMISERLNEIALMHVHQEIEPDIEKVTDLFAVPKWNGLFHFIFIGI